MMNEGGLGTGQLSLRGLQEGDLEEWLLYWGPQKIRSVRLSNGCLFP